ncbi:UbiA family prenyltransferase [Candidatus Viridilinea mediisalina]|uniref:Prenyltransferase n=1 Tax=Candidatus Viridilinea mediisalina TaxID=2024553 RepID=A0A2A6RJH4_9CHLR|nr:UbiA family prenyltransferase [Candidatus Viridilinea mediisalina]PDW03103.1 hypothetical protein CJ255_10670 [Candidatus Viridilinea mediisalina]
MLRDLYHTFRFSAFGATAVLPLAGAAAADPRLTLRQALGLLGVAAAFHGFAYLDNDRCDLELDRSQPLRADYPLVRGALSNAAACGLSLGCVGLAYALDALGFAPRRTAARRMRITLAFGLLAIYNRWGKRCPLPPLTDGLQGLGWAALLAYGAAATGRPDGSLLRWLMAYELVVIMQVNGIHGSLRDLANDAACGARTTALWLGARPTTTGGFHLTPALVGYALSLQAALWALPYATLCQLAPPQRRAAACGVTLTNGFTLTLFLLAAVRRPLQPAAVGMLHLILILSTPLALVAPGMALAPRGVLLLAHGLPLLANGMTYDALRLLDVRTAG